MAEPLSEPSPDEDLDDAEAAAAAEERMQSVQRGFAAAKAAGVGAASRLMKELRQVSLSGNFEVTLVQDSLLVWEVRLFEWAFADDRSWDLCPEEPFLWGVLGTAPPPPPPP